jgi:hypothetical protein
MTESLSTVLRAVVNPHIPSALISSEHLEQINATVQHLPAEITTFFGYECRLQESKPRADFLLCVYPKIGRQILAGENNLLTENLFSVPSWNLIRSFAQEWANPASSFASKILNMWLEFDIDESSSAIPVPSAFFKPENNAIAPGNDYQWLKQALIVLKGQPLSDNVMSSLNQCIEALPSGGYAFQVAAMFSRPMKFLRLCLRNIEPGEIPLYLERIGWTGNQATVKELLHWLNQRVNNITLNLDVSDEVLPTIGLECYFNFDNTVYERIESFLDELVEKGLCLPEKRDGLLAYPGLVHQGINAENWPLYLKWESVFYKRDKISVFWRFLHHIKFVLRPDGRLEVKAYLRVNHSWFSLDDLNLAYKKANISWDWNFPSQTHESLDLVNQQVPT